ncbi:MAG: hypothetical protein IJD57_03595 [Candidatus Gastranaerophilales bacterium]|nr:hypothetical protein [Candidatus Gastranaerophilales bacterium]
MKKFLILLLSLFCLKLGAYAVGVDCWEEYTIEKTEPTTSALRTAITNAGGTVVKLHTRALVAVFTSHLKYSTNNAFAGISDVVSQIYLFNDGSYWDNYSLRKDAYNSSSDTSTYGTIEQIRTIKDRYSSSDYYPGLISLQPTYYDSGNAYMYTLKENQFVTHFVHTYCTVNTSTGGGGGGATGSVNFIIKATS